MPTNCNHCSFLRRIACIIYDTVVVAALWMLAAFPVVALHNAPIESGTFWFQAYLAAVTGTYFVWSWWRGGQTLGMRAWRVHLMSDRHPTPKLSACLLRYFTAYLSSFALGAGWLWALGHPTARTWHDLATGTYLVRYKKQ